MRSILALPLALIAAPVFAGGPHFGSAGGIGSETSTYSGGEPTGGTFSINGATGVGVMSGLKVGSTQSSATPFSVQVNGEGSPEYTGQATSLVQTYSRHSGLVSQITGAATTLGGGASAAVGAHFSGITGAGANPVWGIASIGQWSAGTPDVNVQAAEFDINNNVSASYAVPKLGVSIVSGGTYTGGWGLYLQSTSQANAFGEGVFVNGWAAGGDGILVKRYSDTSPSGYFQRFMTAAGGVLSYTDTGGNSLAQSFNINGAAGSGRPLLWSSAGVPRFQIVANGTTESGSNAGSNLDFNGYSDTGALLGTAIEINRASLSVGINGAATLGGTLSMPNYKLASFGPTGLLESVVPNTESASKFTVRHPLGGVAVLASTQTSDSTNTGGDSTVALEGFAFNNNAAQLQNAHAAYLEARSAGPVGATLGIESAVVRTGSAAPIITPFTMVQNGMAVSYWGTSGRSDVGTSYDASAWGGVYRGSTTAGAQTYYQSGLVFDYMSLDPAGAMNAIHMPLPYNERWSDASHDGLTINGTTFQANMWGSTGYTQNFIRAEAAGANTAAGDTLGSINFYGTQSGAPLLRATLSSAMVNTGRGNLNLSATNDAGTLDTVSLNGGVNHSFGPATASIVSSGSATLPWANTYTQAMKLTPVTYASLPSCASGLEGTLVSVTDSNSASFNTTIAGGGTNHVMGYCNGTNWTVH